MSFEQNLETFHDARYSGVYDDITSLSSKPLALVEFGVEEYPQKPQWIRDMLATLQSGRYPRVQAISWWNSADVNTWIESSPAAQQAFHDIAQSTLFAAKPQFSGDCLPERPVSVRYAHGSLSWRAVPDATGYEIWRGRKRLATTVTPRYAGPRAVYRVRGRQPARRRPLRRHRRPTVKGARGAMFRLTGIGAALLMTALSGAAQSGAPLSPAWVPDGWDGIDAMVAVGGRVYLGGDFSHLGEPFGAFVVYRPGSEVPEASVVRFRDGGEITSLIDDGRGGWFAGGTFESFAGIACPGLVHVLASGRVDPGWCPKPNGVVALLRQGHVLYVVGSHLFALDTRSGRSLPWRVRLGESAEIHPPNVWALAATSRLVYLGGGFASVDGRPAKRLAAVDPQSARLVWAAQVEGGPVETLLVADGRLLALGGFRRVDGRTCHGFAAFDATSGRLLAWRPQATIAGSSAAVASPRALYFDYGPARGRARASSRSTQRRGEHSGSADNWPHRSHYSAITCSSTRREQ